MSKRKGTCPVGSFAAGKARFGHQDRPRIAKVATDRPDGRRDAGLVLTASAVAAALLASAAMARNRPVLVPLIGFSGWTRACCVVLVGAERAPTERYFLRHAITASQVSFIAHFRSYLDGAFWQPRWTSSFNLRSALCEQTPMRAHWVGTSSMTFGLR